MQPSAPTPPAPAGERQVERRIVSVLFADLVAFTSLSERLDPEDVATIQDAYFAAVRETIGRYGGVLEKFIGDAVMAVFGLPRTRDDDAERAVRAGLALVGAIEQVGARLGFEPGDLRLRVGVNTGEVVHAGSGPDEGRVTGDTVNTAARLQTAAAPNTVVVGEKTALAVAGAIEVQEMEALQLKGKSAPVRAWTAVGIRAESSRDHALGSLRAPILGRDDELATLDGWLGLVGSGRAALGLIVAPPGVGKTRLVDEFVTRAGAGSGPRQPGNAKAGPPVVVRARLNSDRVAPYDGVAQLMAGAMTLAGLTTVEGAGGPNGSAGMVALLEERLSRAGLPQARSRVIAEDIGAVVWPAAGAENTPRAGLSGEREAHFAAWIEGLDALLGEGPSIWVVEDVHWAGGDLLAFLGQAATAPRLGGRLVLATGRPSVLERATAWKHEDDERGILLLELGPLLASDAEVLISALVGSALSPDVVRTIAARSDGNPLLIEELLRTWISVGTLAATEDGSWRLTTAATEVPLPATVQAMYSAQIDDLPPAARLAARRGAVAGRRFPIAALDRLGVPEPEAAVQILLERGLVAGPVPDPLLGPAYSYRHALLRDAGYASLTRAERARLHVRLARWLEEAAGHRAAETAEVIAGHYAAALESAPDLQREIAEGLDRATAAHAAAEWFERGAEGALSIAAYDAALTLYRRALDLTPKQAAFDRARLLERLGAATAFAADMDEGAKALEESLELYRTLFATSRTGVARAAGALGQVWNEQVKFPQAVDLAMRSLAEIGERSDPETGDLLVLKGWSFHQGTDAVDEPMADVGRALAIASELGDEALELRALEALTSIRTAVGLVSEQEMQQMADLAARRNRPDLATRWIRIRAADMIDDRAEEAAPLLDRALEMAQAHGLLEQVAWTHYSQAEAGLVSGAWDRALEEGVRGIDLGERNAYHRSVVRTWFTLAPILWARPVNPLLDRCFRWFAQHSQTLPSPRAPWAEVMLGAMEVRFGSAGLAETIVPPVELCMPAFEQAQGMPSWFAAMEVVLDAWLQAGEAAAVRRALDLSAVWNGAEKAAALSRGTEALMRARLAGAEQAAASDVAAMAQSALELFGASKAQWWIGKAIRVLESVDAAEPKLSARAEQIERDLGIARPGSA